MALQTMYIHATEVWCYRSGWKSDVARFGTASGGHYTHSQIKFTPSAEDLAKLRNSRITSVTSSLTFAKLGSSGTKTIRFGFSREDNYWITVTSAYNQVRWPTIWTGNSLDDSSNWGARFLAQLKNNSSVTIYIENGRMDVPSGKDYASNYGGIKLPSYLAVTYEPLSSELEISDGQSFDLGVLNAVPLTRYSSDYTETAILKYTSDKGEEQNLALSNSSDPSDPSFSFTLPLSIANDSIKNSSISGQIILSTAQNGTTIGEDKIYNININIPSSIFFTKGENWKITGVSDKINENYFVQSFSKAQIYCDFVSYQEDGFKDSSTIKSCTIKNSSLNISAAMTKITTDGLSYSYETPILNTSGEIYFDIIVENSRGQKQTFHTSAIIIQSYSNPQIVDISLNRINKNGVLDEEGKFLVWSGTIKYSNVNLTSSNKNVPISLSLSFLGRTKDFTINSSNLNSSNILTVNLIDSEVDELFSVDKSYEIKAKVKDTLGRQSSERKETLTTTKYLIHFSKGGHALGLGSAAINENKITCGFDMFFNHSNGALKINEGGTEAIDRNGAWENIVAPGGTITEDLTIGKIDNLKTLKIYDDLSLFGKGSIGSGDARIRFFDSNYNQAGSPIGGFWCKPFSDSARINKLQFFQSSPTSEDTKLATGKYEWYSLPEVDLGLAEDKSYEILTTKRYPAPSDFYVNKQETITFTDLFAMGHVSSSNTRLYFSIPIYKSLAKITNVTIQEAVGAVRCDGVYIQGSSGGAANMMGTSRWAVIQYNSNTIQLFFEYSTAMSKNNFPCQCSFAKLTLYCE